MYPVHHGGGNLSYTELPGHFRGTFCALTSCNSRSAPRSQHRMTFNVSLALGLPFVRPGTVARILFAFFALVAASSGTQAQTVTATPTASPLATPASSNPTSAPTPATAGIDPKAASDGGTVVVPPE